MSWSLNINGKPSDLSKEIDNQSNSLTGSSKTEFDTVKDSIKSLLAQNTDDVGLLQLDASGHSYSTGTPAVTKSNCFITLKQLPGRHVNWNLSAK